MWRSYDLTRFHGDLKGHAPQQLNSRLFTEKKLQSKKYTKWRKWSLRSTNSPWLRVLGHAGLLGPIQLNRDSLGQPSWQLAAVPPPSCYEERESFNSVCTSLKILLKLMRPIWLREPPGGLRGIPGMLEGAIRRAVVIGNGFAGAESQCIGLVRALGLTNRYSLHRVARPSGGINKWLHWLPVSLHKRLDSILDRVFGTSQFHKGGSRIMPFSAENSGLSDILEADAQQIAMMARETFNKDGPLLVIASGRDTIDVTSSIKRLAPENVFVVQIQHPRSHLDRFDLIIAPRHDYYPLTPEGQKEIPWFLRKWITPRQPPGRNVILTAGALHLADSNAIVAATSGWHNEFGTLPKPFLVVNIGGPTRNCRYAEDLAEELVEKLQNVLWSCGSIRISFSRRTPEKISRIIKKELSADPKVHIWDGEGRNPHMGHLAWADAFVVTADSVSMLSEVCSTGKPVYVAGAEHCTWKFTDFQRSLQVRGAIRSFLGEENMSDTWSYPPLNDTAEAAAQVSEAVAQRGWRILGDAASL